MFGPFLHSIIKLTKGKFEMFWACSMQENNVINISGKLLGKRPCWRLKYLWRDNVTMDPKEVGYEMEVNW